MRKITYILLFLISYTAYSQSLTVFNVDTSAFPIIKANLFAFDAAGKQITNLSPSDFSVKENGQPRTIINVTCEDKQKLIALSSVLVFDISISMSWGPPRIQSAKDAANAWVDGLALGTSECALVSFENKSYIVRDFTTNRQLLKKNISEFTPGGGTDYNQALLDPPCGGLQVAMRGKYKKVIVFLTDGLSVFEPKTAEIIKFAKENQITIYAVTLDMPAPKCIKDMTTQTGGTYFENILTQKEAEDIYTKLLNLTQVGENCQIEWLSDAPCEEELRYANIDLNSINATSTVIYLTPKNILAKLKFTPSSIKFKNVVPGIKKDTIITVEAINSDFYVPDISISNPAYLITPKSFFLRSGETQNLTISYLPADSGYSCAKFIFDNYKCPFKYYAAGGFPNKKVKIQTLKVIQPNGGENFIVGMDTTITWEGVLPEEKVKIEYTKDNGINWVTITDSAKNLNYKWIIPKTPSNQCLARITANAPKSSECNEVIIGNQIWMGCNLDVETYRDGTPIQEVLDPTEWANLTTGAWCYYENDPTNGKIYGKLYNWYAVNDSRGLAPNGWHIPTDKEWTELSNSLGGENNAGGKLKSKGTLEDGDGLWNPPNEGATNSTGYSALPGGYRKKDGSFDEIGMFGYWCSSTIYTADLVWYRNMAYYGTALYPYHTSKVVGYSVRCIKD